MGRYLPIPDSQKTECCVSLQSTHHRFGFPITMRWWYRSVSFEYASGLLSFCRLIIGPKGAVSVHLYARLIRPCLIQSWIKSSLDLQKRSSSKPFSTLPRNSSPNVLCRLASSRSTTCGQISYITSSCSSISSDANSGSNGFHHDLTS